MAVTWREKADAYPANGAFTIIDPEVTNTVQANVMSGSATVYVVMIDCSLNSSEAVYIKIKNATSIGSTGTCQPDHQYYCPAGEKMQYSIPEGLVLGTGLSYYASQEAGVGGTTDPTGTVKVYMVTTA